jgi:hypothetical protein
MCGPADYEALYTCAERLAALSAAGLSTYALGQLAEVVRKTRQRSKKDQACIPVREGFVAADR